MLPNTNKDGDVEDETSLQENKRFIDEMTKVPATSEDFSHSPHRRGTGGGRYQRGNNQTFLTVSVSQVILLNWRHHHYQCPTGFQGLAVALLDLLAPTSVQIEHIKKLYGVH